MKTLMIAMIAAVMLFGIAMATEPLSFESVKTTPVDSKVKLEVVLNGTDFAALKAYPSLTGRGDNLEVKGEVKDGKVYFTATLKPFTRLNFVTDTGAWGEINPGLADALKEEFGADLLLKVDTEPNGASALQIVKP